MAQEQDAYPDLGGTHGYEADEQRETGREPPALEGVGAVGREAEERPHLGLARVVPRAMRPGGRSPARARREQTAAALVTASPGSHDLSVADRRGVPAVLALADQAPERLHRRS